MHLYYVCVKRIKLCNCLCSSCFSASHLRDFGIVNRCSRFWKFLNMADLGVQLFPRYSCKKWYKNWHFDFYKTYGNQIWQADMSRGVDSSEGSQMRLIKRVLVTSRSRYKLKHLHYHKVYGHNTWQDVNWPWTPTHNIPVSLGHVTN